MALEGLLHLHRMNSQEAIVTSPCGHEAGAIDRDGEHPSFVVVEMAADEIYSTGRAKDARRGAKHIAEGVSYSVWRGHRE